MVNSEKIERIESYVKVNNARTLKSLNEEGVIHNSWEILTDETVDVREDFKLADGWLLSIVKVSNLTIDGNPDIKKGLRVYIHDEQGNKLEETLYLAVGDDGVIGRDDVCYELRSYDDVLEAANKKAELFVLEFMDYFNIDVSDLDFKRIIGYSKWSLQGKHSYDVIYKHSVAWLMWEIKMQRETEASVRELYDEDGLIIASKL